MEQHMRFWNGTEAAWTREGDNFYRDGVQMKLIDYWNDYEAQIHDYKDFGTHRGYSVGAWIPERRDTE